MSTVSSINDRDQSLTQEAGIREVVETKDDIDDDDEEILSANSPLGRYATEVGLTDAVTASLPLDAECLADWQTGEVKAEMMVDDNVEEVGILGLVARFAVSRAVATNAASLRNLLDDDDMRRLVLALADDDLRWRGRCQGQFLLGKMAIVLALVVACCFCFLTYAACLSCVAVCVVLAATPWLALRLLSRWLASLLMAIERCLGTQKDCLRLARERLQVERGFTLIRGASSAHRKDVAVSPTLPRAAPALSQAAFESARRLTHSIRRLARNVGLDGLAALTDDTEFGEAFNNSLTSTELTTATDGFSPTAIASMAALLQMHLSDIMLRLLLTCGFSYNGCSPRRLVDLLRAIACFASELSSESDALEAQFDRYRRRDVADVDTLLEEFLGCSGVVTLKTPLKVDAASNATPLHAAAHSLRLQAEALLVKAVLVERQASQSTSTTLVEVADLALEARVYAVNAASCCDEIEAAVKPPATPWQSPQPSTSLLTAEGNTARPVLVVSPDTEPSVEDEFLEGLVPDSDSDRDCDGDTRDVGVADVDEAARRAATRRVLGELDAVILQRRRLFRQREQAARSRRGLPQLDGDGDGADDPVNGDGDAIPRVRCRRRIVWHGTLEGEGGCGDGDSGVVMPPVASRFFGAASSSFAAAALAARQERGIRLSEEAFGDSDDKDGD